RRAIIFGGPRIQPVRRPGRPNAFDRPAVIKTLSWRPQNVAEVVPDTSAPRYTSSETIQAPVLRAACTIDSISSPVKIAPVGLFGLVTRITFVRRVIERSRLPMSSAQRPRPL